MKKFAPDLLSELRVLINEDYIVKFLLEETRDGKVRWAQIEEGGYWAAVNGVRIVLGSSQCLFGQRLHLRLEFDDATTQILEPRLSGPLRQRHRDESEEQLANDLLALAQEVQWQQVRREVLSESTSVRQAIYRRMLFADGADGD